VEQLPKWPAEINSAGRTERGPGALKWETPLRKRPVAVRSLNEPDRPFCPFLSSALFTAAVAPHIATVVPEIAPVMADVPAVVPEIALISADIAPLSAGSDFVAVCYSAMQLSPVTGQIATVVPEIAPVMADVPAVVPDILAGLRHCRRAQAQRGTQQQRSHSFAKSSHT
jgi:hypothetical protein